MQKSEGFRKTFPPMYQVRLLLLQRENTDLSYSGNWTKLAQWLASPISVMTLRLLERNTRCVENFAASWTCFQSCLHCWEKGESEREEKKRKFPTFTLVQ